MRCTSNALSMTPARMFHSQNSMQAFCPPACDCRHMKPFLKQPRPAATLQLCSADFTASPRVFVAPYLFLALGYNRRYSQVPSLSIDSHEGQVGRTDMLHRVSDVVFDPGLHPNFHGGVKDPIDR